MRAYISVLATDNYLFGVLVLHKSLLDTKSTYPLHVCVTENLSQHTLDMLNMYNIKTINVKRRDSPTMPPFNKWRATYTKLEIFKLTNYDKIVYLDADMIVLKNIDHLFDKPHMSAVAAGCWSKKMKKFNFNSGLLVIKPCLKEYNSLIEISEKYGNICSGDQDVMQKYFITWPSDEHLHLDHAYNIFASQLCYTKTKYYFFEPKKNLNPVYIIHYICPKPWDDKDKHLIKDDVKFLYDRWTMIQNKYILT